MEAKSKFNIGSVIYFMIGERPSKAIITGITFFVGAKYIINGECWDTEDEGKCLVTYHVRETIYPIKEKEAYATKEELREATFASL